jgi:hypothetical protein
MVDRSLATAADYADAMLTARRAKNILFGILFLTLIAQIVLFLVGRYRVDLSEQNHATDVLRYFVGITDFFGLVLPVVMGVDLFMIAVIMLVGRLIGVSRVISSFLWCVILAVLLFPWQAFLINYTFTSPELKIPGVLYNWTDLVMQGRFQPEHFTHQWVLYWGRFVGWPVIAVIILLKIQMQSRTGLRQALGESSLQSTSGSADNAA